MFVAVVTPPADPFVSLDQAKAHLRVDHDDEDDSITGYVAAAIGQLDGPEGDLNRALAEQVLRATIEGFPDEPLVLPCGPVASIDEVTYVAADGSAGIVDEDVYELTDDGRIRLAYGQEWPTVRSAQDPVRIKYSAGFETTPERFQQAVLLMVGDLYANRETVAAGVVSKIPMSATVWSLVGNPVRRA